MTDDEIAEFRASERERMEPMREAMRKEAFVQGYLHGKFGDVSIVSDAELLAVLPDADAAYATHRSRRAR